MAGAARHHKSVSEALAGLALPPFTRRLLDLLGPDALIALSRQYGGTRCYVPQAVTPDHALAICCGLEPARRLSAEFPSETIPVPLLAGFDRALRDAAIRAAWATSSARDLARRFGVTERSIFRVLASSDDGQMDLFDEA
jgi:hypothetical protein